MTNDNRLMDCGDSTCTMAPRPLRGVRTNGGCRCLKPVRIHLRIAIARHVQAMWERIEELERYVEHRTGCDPTAEARVRELEDKLRWYRTRAAKDQHAYSNLSDYWLEQLGEHLERGEAIRITREGMEGLLSVVQRASRSQELDSKLRRIRDALKYAANSDGGIVSEIDETLGRDE